MLDVCLSVKWGPTRTFCPVDVMLRDADQRRKPVVLRHVTLHISHISWGCCILFGAFSWLVSFWKSPGFCFSCSCCCCSAAWLMLSTFVIRRQKKSARRREKVGGGNGMVCSKREMHKNLLRFILPHAKDAPSCHSQQQQQLFQRAAVVTALESWRGLPLPLAYFTPHMPVYLWCCLWLWLRCSALCWAFKRLKVCTQFLLCHIPDTCCAVSTSTLLVVFLTGWVRCSASAYAELKYKLSMQVGQMLPQRGTWA